MRLLSRKFHHTYDRSNGRRILISGLISLAAFMALHLFSPRTYIPYSDEMLSAARIMERAVTAVAEHSRAAGMAFDDSIDPNHTGLIGAELTEITTTLGHLEAKRTTTNPNIAALIVHFLEQVGAKPGDTLAIGSSASFPALLIASVAAAEAAQFHPIVIISLGASSFGANNTEFNLLDMYELLLEESILRTAPTAVSLGGERDTGDDYDPVVKERLRRQIERSAVPLIHEPDLEKNVGMRMRIYGMASSAVPVTAFINTGGSYANLGTSSLVLTIKPGVNTIKTFPPLRERGVLYTMAAHGVPCIHLLFIKGLAISYGLPWDPVPLPGVGETALITPENARENVFWSIAIPYALLLCITWLYRRRSASQISAFER